MISVAICTYNGEKFVNRQLESIANQTLPVDEIVICDDKSTDSTVQIIETFASRNPNILVRLIINEDNLGVRMNFEKALNLCKGDIKFLSDQDDIWFPNKVETFYEYFNTHPQKKVVFSNATLIDTNDQPCSRYTLFESLGLDNYGLQLCDNGYLLNVFVTGGRSWGATMAIRKEVICNFNYPTQMYHDYILALEAILNNSLGYIKEPLMDYRIHNNQKVGLGDAFLDPPRINIYDLEHGNMQGYPCPPALQREIDIRDLRYSFFVSGLRGIPKILLNYHKYKKHYKSDWIKFIKADIDRIIVRYKIAHR
ncbi:MAG: glycosyltransferase [Bacteroidales bacterium]|nr:glycosyltransferase [Bacteroidales bacterium]